METIDAMKQARDALKYWNTSFADGIPHPIGASALTVIETAITREEISSAGTTPTPEPTAEHARAGRQCELYPQRSANILKKKHTMKLHILFGQRKERYPGEYMPEALAVMDEYGHSDNPEYLDGEMGKAVATGEFESVVVVTMEVNGAKVMELLRPAKPVLPAQIIEPA